MTLAIEAGLNPGDLSLQAIPVTEGGGSDFVSLASATTYAHRAMTTATGGYAALSTTLEVALNTASGLSETYTVTYDPFAGFYKISLRGALQYRVQRKREPNPRPQAHAELAVEVAGNRVFNSVAVVGRDDDSARAAYALAHRALGRSLPSAGSRSPPCCRASRKSAWLARRLRT